MGKKKKLNLLEPMGANEINTLNKFFKSDLNININHNNIIINENNNIYLKKTKLNNSKENHDKSIKKNNKNLLLELSKKQINENNNKYIKKTVINELLSICSSSKDTWRTAKMTESQRENSHSINKTEREKKSIKFKNNKKNTKNKKI